MLDPTASKIAPEIPLTIMPMTQTQFRCENWSPDVNVPILLEISLRIDGLARARLLDAAPGFAAMRLVALAGALSAANRYLHRSARGV